MEFQLSYFKFYKMMLWKGYTKYVSKLENAAVVTGLEKVRFHSNPKERQCQRMFKLSHNCTLLTRYQSNTQNSPSQASTVCELWCSVRSCIRHYWQNGGTAPSPSPHLAGTVPGWRSWALWFWLVLSFFWLSWLERMLRCLREAWESTKPFAVVPRK